MMVCATSMVSTTAVVVITTVTPTSRVRAVVAWLVGSIRGLCVGVFGAFVNDCVAAGRGAVVALRHFLDVV